MAKVGIVTDSVASIPDRLMTDLEIYWIPYYLHRGDEVLRDLVTIQRDAFYHWLPSARELPKTASPGPGDYIEQYEGMVARGITEIVSIHMTSKGSGAYQAAVAAKNLITDTLPQLRIEVIDTLNVSMCHGWMVIEAARSALAGNSFLDIIAQVRALIPKARMIQTADTLKYLYLGGRIGKARHLLGSLLNIKPLISMEDGEIVAVGQTRSRGEAYRAITRLVEKAVGYKGRIKIAYVHAAALDEVLKLREMVDERLTAVETLVCELTPALGVHTGPGTVGVCYYPV
jgi:DegV family protein with EDD domain